MSLLNTFRARWVITISWHHMLHNSNTKKHFAGKFPCCKLVSLSACNFLLCGFSCGLKISYLVPPCWCIIVNTLLSPLLPSITFSLVIQCECLSKWCRNKKSWRLSRSGSTYGSSHQWWKRRLLQSSSAVWLLTCSCLCVYTCLCFGCIDYFSAAGSDYFNHQLFSRLITCQRNSETADYMYTEPKVTSSD